MKNLLLLLYALLLITFPLLAKTPSSLTPYQIKPIYSGKQSIQINGVNNHGYIVGNADGKAFIFHADYGFTFIKTPLNYSDALFINDQGIVAGIFAKEAPCQEWKNNYQKGVYGFVYDLTTNEFVDIRDYDTGELGIEPKGITEDGKVLFAQHHQPSWPSNINLFLFDFPAKTTWMVNLNEYPVYMNKKGQILGSNWIYDELSGFHSFKQTSSLWWQCLKLSDQGHVIGCFGGWNSPNAFFWHPDKDFIAFQGTNNLYDDDSINIPRGVNNLGQTVGHSFIFDPEKGLSNFDKEIYFRDINDSGYVVGQNETQAIIWDETHGIRNLSDLIPPKSGWTTLYSAELIAENGTIIGYGLYKGKARDFVMTPTKKAVD